MKRFTTRCPHITQRVIFQLHKSLKPGEEVTDAKWNAAYALVHAQACAETLEWKYAHLTKVPWQ